jgi:micrococcal nuclease
MAYELKPNQKVTIKTVYDGDTFLLVPEDLPKGTKADVKVRLRWVDAPETYKGVPSDAPVDLNQWEWGNKAKELILSLGSVGVTVNPHGLDKYNRVLADVDIKVDEKIINVQHHLVSNGLAVVFPSFENNHLWSEADIDFLNKLLKAQFEAHKNRLGVWGDDNFVLPYLYRSQKGIGK